MPIHFLEKAVPQLMPIIYELNSRVVKKFDDKSVAIIDDERRVHMAHMDIHYGYQHQRCCIPSHRDLKEL